ncbi:MAG TPA: DUF2608 domain-containing protein [Nautiliaceae bacterium]|nr:DUF2608 domain-containing protein [Nautiliaceae bacterium]
MYKYEKIVICDLDGTLVDDSVALKKASKEIIGKELDKQEIRKLNKSLKGKIYDLAQRKMNYFIPKKRIINLVNKLKSEGFFVLILTARLNKVKKETEELLKKIGVNYDLLIMRNSEELKIDDEIWKKEKAKGFFGKENVYLEDKIENILFLMESFKENRKNKEKGLFYLIIEDFPFFYEFRD